MDSTISKAPDLQRQNGRSKKKWCFEDFRNEVKPFDTQDQTKSDYAYVEPLVGLSYSDGK